jgi:hypothetical protein
MKKKPSRKTTNKREQKFVLSRAIYILDSFVNIDVVGWNVVICSRWPAIQRYSWIFDEVFSLSSKLLPGVNGTDWVVVEGVFVFFVRVIRLNKCFKNLYRAKQQSFSK